MTDGTTAPDSPAPEAKPEQRRPHSRPVRKTQIAFLKWRREIVAEIDHEGVMAKVRDESDWAPRYVFMVAMSAGIAILGLLLSSPAVVIGAMLLSPLMGPILGVGFALATADAHWLKQCTRVLLIGSITAVAFCALIVMFSPLQTVTEEIAARTRPNLFDLVVALFSALAGSYAMIRGREGTIVGVAIATALMPPLAVVGYGLATWNWTVFGGALLLFFTNLMTIALTAAVMARLYGFSAELTPRQSLAQNGVIIAIFIGLAIPLGYSLQQIAWESNASRTASNIVSDQFGPLARVSEIGIDFDSSPIKVTASVFTSQFEPEAEDRASRMLSRSLNRDIEVTINQYRVGTEQGDAESAEIAAARAKEQAAASEREITQMADRVALIAGVGTESILIDRQQKRAIVRATELPGAGIETYYALENRVAKLEPDWKLLVRPPAMELPAIPLDGEEDEWSTDARSRLALAAWAVERVDAPVGVGGAQEAAERAVDYFRQRGIAATYRQGQSAPRGQLSLDWLAPDEAPPPPPVLPAAPVRKAAQPE